MTFLAEILLYLENAAPLGVCALIFLIAMALAVRSAYRKGWDARGRELTDRLLAETRRHSSIRQ